jgi:AP-1 complex subunit sigma 1/2
MAVHFLILMSKAGKVRLAKWYSTYSQKERARVIKETTPLVLARPLKLCNFLDWKGLKLIYKRYASLYFVCGVDTGDNELITLEIIHEFVEVGILHGQTQQVSRCPPTGSLESC